MDSLSIQETKVIVLAEGDTPAAAANRRGHLFERFVAKILERFGYDEPRVRNLNASADGIELDVVVSHKLTKRKAIAECKALSSPVEAKELDAFYGKLGATRFTEENVEGFFFAVPRLSKNGAEQAQLIESKDADFKYLDADSISEVAQELHVIERIPDQHSTPTDDHAIIITEHGTYAACKMLDPQTRTAAEIVVQGRASVPTPVLDLLQTSGYAEGIPVRDYRMSKDGVGKSTSGAEQPMVVEVRGSQSDFEYQLPASPRYFVGRNRVVNDLVEVLNSAPTVLVVNAQSGWGKSSLALRLRHSVQQNYGYAAIFDSRSANDRNYVTAALRVAALEAERARLLSLPPSASWASLTSALDTLKNTYWHNQTGTLLIFFDQFENVFRDEDLTREFRDLALGIHEIGGRVVIGFAWKTDLVGWTESYPYQLRDQIKANAEIHHLSPLGPREVGTLLRRLEKSLGEKLIPDLKQRLREYSQGLPWLFKKLAGHVLREVQGTGTTQAKLVSEALNVQNLFEADLAELQPKEREGLLYIARYAPAPVSEVMETVSAVVVQSLLDRRLVVQVGERLDTYWDIFRDFLTTGRIPIEDSYILRTSPVSAGRMLQEVIADGGDASVTELATRLETSENVVYNLSREMRLFGALAYEPNHVRLIDEIVRAKDREEELRQRVAIALRRHRAYSTFIRLAEQSGGGITQAAFARALPATFPAVAVAETTWTMYARACAQWFDYAGLAVFRNQNIFLVDEDSKPSRNLLTGTTPRGVPGTFPQRAPGPSLSLLKDLAENGARRAKPDRHSSKARRDLLALGLLQIDDDGMMRLARKDIVKDGQVDRTILRDLIECRVGGSEALAALEKDPSTPPAAVGEVLRHALGASWNDATTAVVGKQFRAWARASGVDVRRPPRAREGSSS